MKSSRSILIWLGRVAAIAVLLAVASFAHPAFAVTNADADANWIMGAVISGGAGAGAIGQYPDPGGSLHIEPYFDNYACMGLARAYQVDPTQTQYIQACWSHLNWFASHLDSSGYAHKWDLVNGTWTEENSPGYDSTDAYAATFLIATLATYRADNDNLAKLQSLNTNNVIQTEVSAIDSTLQSSGLTDAKPGYTGELLEDNGETCQGLMAAGELATILGNTTLAAHAYNEAETMRNAINSEMWDGMSNQNWYYDAIFNNGSTQTTNPTTTLSPDLMAQGWTTSFMITGSHASAVFSLISSFRNPTTGATWDGIGNDGLNTDGSDHTVWDVTLMGWGYFFNGDESDAQSAASTIRSEAYGTNLDWPFQTADAGELIVLETDGEKLLFATPPEPSGLTATPGNSQVALSWTPTPGANVYNVYRSTTSQTETLYASAISTTSYTDTGVTNGTKYYYTIGAFNDIGASPMSGEVSATPGNIVTIDPLNDFSIVNNMSANWTIDTTAPADFNGDTARAKRTVNDTEYLDYKFPDISTFNAKVYIYIGPIGTATFQVSTNGGSTFSNVAVNTGTETMSENNWGYYNVTPSGALPAGVTDLKVIFSKGANNPIYDPQLSQISITHQ